MDQYLLRIGASNESEKLSKTSSPVHPNKYSTMALAEREIIRNDNLIRSTSMTIFIMSLVVQLSMLTKYGQMIIDEHSRIGIAAYNCHWYKYGPRFRRSILLVIQRSQKPLSTTIAKFNFMSHASFAQVMKTTYSYYNILQNLNTRR
ncbi:odorant receptor 4-like [Arctopsyche grandis]|uniref:odorant receptor 4-like n=1 Tax=Arctopsyche grandis TaxID=121162 RepID=UPI00406D862E